MGGLWQEDGDELSTTQCRGAQRAGGAAERGAEQRAICALRDGYFSARPCRPGAEDSRATISFSVKKQFTIRVGTILEDSPIKFDKWICAFWLISNAKNGISSYEVGRALGVTQRTGWFMLQRIRLALQNGTIVKIGGHIEADETFIGGKARFMHKGKRKTKGTRPVAMTPVMGLLERTTKKRASRVILKVVDTTRKAELQGQVRDYVLKGSEVHTDALKSYEGLNDEYTHNVIDHAVCNAQAQL